MIGPSQRSLPDNTHTKHSQETNIHFEPAMPASEQPQTHALDRTVTGIGRPWALGTLIYEGVKLQRRRSVARNS